MKTLEKGKNKLGEICAVLRKETLEPAQLEADKIIEAARAENRQIIARAKQEAEALILKAQQTIAQERKLFESSMDLAAKQSFDQLKQQIEQRLFDAQIAHITDLFLKDGSGMAQLVAAVIRSVETEGVHTNLALALAKNISPEDVSLALAGDVAKKIKEKAIPIDLLERGASIKLVDQKLSVEISDQSLKELLGSFLRESFRKVLFHSDQ